ncbi:unnamed protein product [Kuraishia capsulata CBS 1993]|uniref:Zn(2)-C6 fungal-type domain-containing protein n=1 Tax=Kuraishia capsulata CBS 1993 TaxID=1382522 RepID=W6MGL1_9ASCO|nr:uncharacterized protein KUCA_T00001241001 [Kuraishia capsulata CBS 1993]CDK25274.1 unnamed protein product [Kuraishia capsulata CBS 1993]
MAKINRVRTGCWTCKERRKKCDETKPICLNCSKGNRQCKGYGVRLSFDIDDSKYTGFKSSVNGSTKYGFVGRPKTGANREAPSDDLSTTPSTDQSEQSVKGFKMVNSFVDTIRTKYSRQDRDAELPDEQMKSPKRTIPVEDLMSEGLHTFLKEMNSPISFSPSSFGTGIRGSGSPLDFSRLSQESPGVVQVETPKTENEEGVSTFMEAANLYPQNIQTDPAYLDENRMLKHFFNKLLPLIDMHPNTPWPELALKYCDFDIAKSCFLSLSCMHLVANENDHRGKAELFMRSVNHIDKIMEYLIVFVQENNLTDVFHDAQKMAELEPQIDIEGMVKKLKEEEDDTGGNKKQSRVFVVLLLIFVQLLYGILENGRSALSRIFFRLFASMTENPECKAILNTIDQSQTLICLLSWWDSIAAITSPDCRLPYCHPEWYGMKDDPISTEKMCGCPGELFICLSEICHIRNGVRYNKLTRFDTLRKYEEIRLALLRYRDYITFDPNGPDVDDFAAKSNEDFFHIRLCCVQCWSLAAQIKLESTVRPTGESEKVILQLVLEFLGVYKQMDPRSHPVGQMVWPLLEVGANCTRESERSVVRAAVDKLYLHTRAMNILTMTQILEHIWRDNISLDDYLNQKEWLKAGIELLAL